MHKKLARVGVALAAAGALLLTGCTATPGSTGTGDGDALTQIRVGILPYASAFPIDEADRTGVFEKNGLEVSKFDVYASGPELLAAMASGQYDIAYLGGPPAINGGAQGIVQIIGISNQQEHAAGVFVRPGTFDPKDAATAFVGQDAIAAVGTNQQFLLNSCLTELGADPADVTAVNVAASNVPATFDQGSGYVMAPWAPQSYHVRADGQYEELCDETSAGVGLYDFYVASTSFAQSQPDAVTRFLASIDEVQSLIESDPEGMAVNAHAFLNRVGNDQSLEDTEIDLGEARFFPSVAEMLEIMGSGKLADDLQIIADFLDSNGALNGEPDFSAIIDASFAEKAKG